MASSPHLYAYVRGLRLPSEIAVGLALLRPAPVQDPAPEDALHSVALCACILSQALSVLLSIWSTNKCQHLFGAAGRRNLQRRRGERIGCVLGPLCGRLSARQSLALLMCSRCCSASRYVAVESTLLQLLTWLLHRQGARPLRHPCIK